MAVRPILVVGNPVLRQKARKVSQFDRSIQKLVEDMIETMRAAPGVGLAAPQVGVPLRLAVIEVDEEVTVIANPEIVKRTGEYEPDEGCLSVPGFWGHVTRAEKVTVKAKDRTGKDFRLNAEGLLAQALQHEIDHLDGMLYIDHPGVVDELKRTEPVRRREAVQEEAAGNGEPRVRQGRRPRRTPPPPDAVPADEPELSPEAIG
ncbi:MAG: peptide deformylase [Chloroflexi bacterium]|nr:peptide deformylase [Chloroflexota bacterium]